MKTKRFILTALAVLAGAGLAMGGTNEVSALLQKGLFEEEANRNLDAAIQAYQAVVTQTDKDRQFAATAVFRLGECYRKQGKTNEANEEYRRIVREFPDQVELAKLSREYVGTPKAAPAFDQEGTQTYIASLQADIDFCKHELAELDGNPKTARVFAQQHFSNPVLTSLVQAAVKTEQELARMKNDLGDKHPDAVRAQELLKTINDQIDAQVGVITKDVQARLFEAQATLSILKKRSAETEKEAAVSGAQGGSPAKPSQEDEAIERYQAMIRDSPDLINANGSGTTPLNSAAKNGQLKVVKFLLDNKANIEARDGVDQTPLLNAAQGEKRDIVELLVGRGADVNAVTQSASGGGIHQGYSALHYAAAAGNKAIAEILLAHGAKVDARDGAGATPLMAAVGMGFKTVAEMLIAHGAEVNARDNEGKSVLIVGIEKNHPLIVDMLLASKADVNLASKDGYTPLIAAVNSGQPDTVKVLLGHGADARAQMAENHASTPRWTALDAAVVMNDTVSLKLLLENHADPNATFDHSDRGNVYERDSTPLILAANYKHLENARILLAHKADVNARDSQGTTALWIAISKSDQPMVELLLDNGADANIGYEYANGWTVLHSIVRDGKKDLAELLLARGANVNATDKSGQTPLHLAVSYGAEQIVKLLLAHGADVNLKDNQGDTALDLAKNSHNPGFMPPMGRPTIPSRPMHFPGSPTSPLSYQWAFNGSGGTEGLESSNSIAALLRQHGALAEIEISSIRAGRDSLQVVFRNGADGHNHFTMFDLIAEMYAPPNWNPFQSAGDREPPGLRFPDFSKIEIIRRDTGGPSKRLNVDLQAALATGDCGKNVPLKWGDMVVIPEADHKVNEHWGGLDEAVRATLKKCLQSKVDIVVKGQSNPVALTVDPPVFANNPYSLQSPWHGYAMGRPGLDASSSGPSPKTEIWSFWLSDVVHQANVILYSSDLTKVKVKRANPQTHQTEEMVFNLEKSASGNDLWLRDGDMIVIPEKE